MPHKGVPPGTHYAWLGNASRHMQELKGDHDQSIIIMYLSNTSKLHCRKHSQPLKLLLSKDFNVDLW